MLFEKRPSQNMIKGSKGTFQSAQSVGPEDESERMDEDASWSCLDANPFLMLDGLKHLGPEDFAFLGSKGSLSVPDREYTREFITQYFIRIHPILPILHEVKFWRAFEEDNREKISLFVFQALLFASCPVSGHKSWKTQIIDDC